MYSSPTTLVQRFDEMDGVVISGGGIGCGRHLLMRVSDQHVAECRISRLQRIRDLRCNDEIEIMECCACIRTR